MKLVNKTGYLKGAKTAKNPVNIIPSNIITTQNMAFPIKANGKTLYPNTGQYKFPTSHVVETPLKKKYQEGTEELSLPDRASEAAKFTYRIKDKKRRDTQVRDMYNNTLDSFRGDTTGAKRMFKSFFKSYGSERFDGVKPLEGYYGFDRKDYDDKTLDSLGRDWHKQMRAPEKIKISKKNEKNKKIQVEPVLKNAVKKHSKPIPAPKIISKVTPKEQLEDNDSWLENAWEVFDPSGTSSYDDVYRSYKNTGLSGETALEAFGALPFIGKIGKGGKIISGGFGLLQKLAPQIKHLPKSMQAKAQKKLFDTYQNYSKNGGKGVDNFLGKTTEWFRDNIPYINPSSQKYIPAARHAFNYSQTGAKVKNAISNALGSKDSSGFKYDPNAKDNTLKFNGRNIFPTMSNEYMYQKGTKNAKAFNLAFAKARKAGEKTFTLNGKSFTTNIKEEAKKVESKPKVDYNDGRTFNLSENIRKRIYDSVNPNHYPLIEAIPAFGRFTSGRKITDEESADVTQADKDAWAFYMGIPQKEKTITRSKYAPTENKTKTKTNYYTIRNAYPAFEDSVVSNASKAFANEKSFWKKASDKVYGNKDTKTKRTGVESSFRPLQNVTYSKGKDKKGYYYSLYDTYDFGLPGEKKIGNPYEIYDRVYYDSTTGKPLYQQKKQGSKDMKTLIKYKDGSKSVSLAFSRGEKDPKGGLTQKGVDKYNRATGGNLKMAVTTPPSKLKPGSKAANRRKSFCARMSGVKGPMAKNGKPTRKALALRKWNC